MDNKDNKINQETPLQNRQQVLRERAEELAREKEAELSVDAQQVLHELRVHQIELEMQNEELRQAQDELENARSRYFDLYDLAPIGYCTLSNDGQVLESNLTLSNMLGVNKNLLGGMRISKFVLREDQDIYYLYIRQLLDIGESRECEFRLVRKDGNVFWVRMVSTALVDSNGVPVYRVMLNDISERKTVEEQILASEAKYKSLFTLDSDALFLLEKRTGDILEANASACSIYGYEPNEFLNLKVTDLSAEPDKTAKALDAMKELSILIPLRYHKKKDGTVFPVEITASMVTLNNLPTVLAAIRDITERKELEIAFANEKILLETTLQSVGDGVISTDNAGKIIFINRVAEALTGWKKEDANGKTIEEVFKIYNELTGEKGKNLIIKVVKDGKTRRYNSHTILVSKDGIEHPVEDSVAPVIQENGEITGAVLVFKDFAEQKKKQDEIEFLSYHDPLTGIYNRRYFDTEIKRLDNENYYPLSLIMTDVNGLKLTNDAFGHKAGDLVLKKVAAILKKECRADDIVARIGGDEFVILLPETDAKHADVIIARINKAMAKEKVNNIVLSLSMGLSVKTNISEDMDEVYRAAEDDMYRHKLTESANMRSKTVYQILNALYESNENESIHSERISKICQAIAAAMGISQEEINQIKIVALMHDIGKIGIDLKILNSSKKISSAEWTEIKRHSEIGYRILSAVNEFSEIADCVLEHHERWDGRGYPRGIKGEKISVFARIVAIADSYEAMTAERTYKKKLSEEEAVEEIKRCAGKQFDPLIAKVFVEKVLGKDWA